MKKNVVVGLGEILWDLLPGGKQLGGAPANFAYHAKALGADAAVASRVGDDELGREILLRVQEMALGAECLTTDPERPTGTVSVELDSAGVPTYIIHENVAWDYIPVSDALLALAGRTDAVCYGTLCQRMPGSRAAISAFLAATPRACLRIFDINLRQRFFSGPVLEATLARSTVVKLSDEELPMVADTLKLDRREPQFVAALQQAYGTKVVALTRGRHGSRLYAGDTCSDHPGYTVEVIDTVGAGDAFTAALTVGLLSGHALHDINERANRLAAYVCTQKGATPRVNLAELDRWVSATACKPQP